ncbi:MAG: hypothetical protein HYS21_05290 [Deltaproteobacteria bacterium]|nr:hypothetical protein [Deltaproteobacteria bacterium]
MKKLGYLAAVVLFLALPAISSAATHYVRSGAAGNNSGSDWTNAYSTLPSTLVRGDTYYIADGSYSSYIFDDPGSTWIYIKKATPSNHGTSVGWSDGYGNASAIFTAPWKFTQGYYEFDGQVGGGPGNWSSGHGIKVLHTANGSLAKIINIATSVPNLTFKHVELGFTPPSATSTSATGQDVIYGVYGGSNWTFQYCWLHQPSRTILYTTKVTGITVDKTLLEKNGLNRSQHSEIWAARDTHSVTVKNSMLLDFVSTGGIIIGRGDGWNIYGNIFRWTSDLGFTANNGAIGTWSSDSTYYARNINIYNNTFIGLKNGGAGKLFPIFVSISNITANNNIWYDSPNTSFGSGVSHDYNWFKGSNESGISETHKETGSGDPFVSIASKNFHLKASTQSGLKLSAPYNIDMDGNTRGIDSTWDRGAYEYSGSASASVPSAPGSLTVN